MYENNEINWWINQIRRDGHLLDTVPHDKRTEAMCLAAVEQNPGALKYVPIERRTESICLEVVRQYGAVLRRHSEALAESRYKDALAEFRGALGYIPEESMTETVCLAIVQQDAYALRQITEMKRTEAVCLAAVQKNGGVLCHVPRENRTDAVWQAAVQQSADALAYIPDDKKSAILKNVAYIIITRCREPDAETEDICSVYANHPKRKNRTLFVTKFYLEELLRELPSETKTVTLAFVGHAAPIAKNLAGYSVDEIHKLCKQYANITQVILLGCNTAQARVFDKEKEMWENVKNKNEQYSQWSGGFYTGTLSEKKTIDVIYQTIFSKKNAVEFAYFLDNEKTLYYTEKNPHVMSPHKIELSEEQVAQLKPLVNKNRDFKYPKTASYQQVNTSLDSEKRKKINTICYGRPERGPNLEPSPAYKERKTLYPYLHTHKIMISGEAKENVEFQRIEDCLLKKVVTALNQDKKFIGPVDIKGYTKPVHVDARAKKLEISHTHLYRAQYTDPLFPNGSNINYKKLDAERAKEEKENTTVQRTDGATTFKAVEIRVAKAKKKNGCTVL